jgi:hypothetical protein
MRKGFEGLYRLVCVQLGQAALGEHERGDGAFNRVAGYHRQMSTRWTAAICLFAGFLGGVASRYTLPAVKEIRAQSFIVEDGSGSVIGRFSGGPIQITLPNGKIALAGSIQLYDGQGRLTWSAPPPPEPTVRRAEAR